MAAKLIISGASGKLGQRVAELVLEQRPAEQLILVTRQPAGLAAFAARGVDVRYGNFDDAATLKQAFMGGERLLLISTTDLKTRTEQHQAAINAAKAAGVAHIIYTSMLSPVPQNPAVITPSHLATEQALMQSSLDWTLLRNSLYADYQVAEAQKQRTAGRFVHNRGQGKIAYVAREDCAAAATAVLASSGHRGAIYEITGPTAYTASELCKLYAEMTASTIEERALDDAAYIDFVAGGDDATGHARFGAELVASFGRAIREHWFAACTNHVQQLTGRPAQPLRAVLQQGLAATNKQ